MPRPPINRERTATGGFADVKQQKGIKEARKKALADKLQGLLMKLPKQLDVEDMRANLKEAEELVWTKG